MKPALLGLIVVLIASGCSQKTETTVGTTASVPPQFAIVPGNVVTAWVQVVTGRVPSIPTQQVAVVRLELSGAEAARFQKFTKDHLNQKVQIVVGTNVVEEPVIAAEIPGPEIELMLPSPSRARAIAEALSKK